MKIIQESYIARKKEKRNLYFKIEKECLKKARKFKNNSIYLVEYFVFLDHRVLITDYVAGCTVLELRDYKPKIKEVEARNVIQKLC